MPSLPTSGAPPPVGVVTRSVLGRARNRRLKSAGFVALLSLLLGVSLAFVPPPTPPVPSRPYTSSSAASLPSRRLAACPYFLSNSFPYSPTLGKTSMFSPMVLKHTPSCAVPRRMRHPCLTSVAVGFDAFVQNWLTAYRISGHYILVMNKSRLTNAWNDLTSAGMVSSSALRYGVAAVLVMA